MTRLTQKQKAQLGGKLARIFGLKLDAKTGKFVIPANMGTTTAVSAEEVFEMTHEVVCCKEGK